MNAPTSTPFAAPQASFDVGALYAGQYLKADDLGGRSYTATIQVVERVEIAEENGAVRPKAALVLQGWPAKLLMNKTNYEAVAAAYGRQSAGWLGRIVEVYPDQTLFGGRSVPCIRVRVPRPAAPPTAVPGAAPMPPGAAPVAAIPDASLAAAPPTQATMLPPLLTTADLGDDIPY